MSIDASSTFKRTADDVSSDSDVGVLDEESVDRPQSVVRSLDEPPTEEMNQKLSITVGEKMPSSEEESDMPNPRGGRRKSPYVLLLLLLLFFPTLRNPDASCEFPHVALLHTVRATLTQPPPSLRFAVVAFPRNSILVGGYLPISLKSRPMR